MVIDALALGWESHLVEVETSLWSPLEQLHHINLKELHAICLALKSFLPSISGKLVQVLTDLRTAFWYCNKQGGVL